MFDIRCLALTIQRNTATPKAVTLHHLEECLCEADITIRHTYAAIVTGPVFENSNCPCGLPHHKGMCKDALIEAQGRAVPKWRA